LHLAQLHINISSVQFLKSIFIWGKEVVWILIRSLLIQANFPLKNLHEVWDLQLSQVFWIWVLLIALSIEH